jgi:hypothetical protein
MEMTASSTVNHKIQVLFHGVGLSCLGGAIFLQILVFSNILVQGYFRAVEANPAILGLEVGLTGFAAIYFVYIYQRLIRVVRQAT